MEQPMIDVRHLGKKYNIAHQRGGYVALRDVLANVAKKPFSFLKTKVKRATGLEKQEAFWALKDVSFSIGRGEIVGVIGRNGAGKSTLLKILTGITPPSEGEAILRGKISSLLEVGTGFHPELTGRENIFLNGAILGMSRREIARKFERIVEFAGIGRFLDTPVKHYSSGMYVRLAFSVAAHMEPDILLVDEVLAVGDAEFQKKCLGKMEEVTRTEGRTILFVSHNMDAIAQLCDKTILLSGGHVEAFGKTEDIIQQYLGTGDAARSLWTNSGDQFDNEYVQPLRLYVAGADGTSLNAPINNRSDAYVYIEGILKTPDPLLCIGYALYNESGHVLYWSYQTDTPQSTWPRLEKGAFTLRSQLPKGLLNEGIYRVRLIGGLHNKEWLFAPHLDTPDVSFEIHGALSDSPYWTTKRPGALAPTIPWEKI